MTRREEYERRLSELNDICRKCVEQNGNDWDRCEMHCDTGDRIRRLENEFADVVPGVSHKNW